MIGRTYRPFGTETCPAMCDGVEASGHLLLVGTDGQRSRVLPREVADVTDNPDAYLAIPYRFKGDTPDAIDHAEGWVTATGRRRARPLGGS